jgi:hypothetical protein
MVFSFLSLSSRTSSWRWFGGFVCYEQRVANGWVQIIGQVSA